MTDQEEVRDPFEDAFGQLYGDGSPEEQEAAKVVFEDGWNSARLFFFATTRAILSMGMSAEELLSEINLELADYDAIVLADDA